MATTAERKVCALSASGGAAVAVAVVYHLAFVVFFNRAVIPAVRVPGGGVGEVLLAVCGDAWGCEDDMAGGDDPGGVGNGEGLFDKAHDRVDCVVHAEGIFDDAGVQGQFVQVAERELG